MGGVTFCRRIVKLLLKTFSSELKSNCWVGDFQVAIHGGFWVATRVKNDFRTKVKKVGGRLLSSGAKLGVKALSLGIIEDSDIEMLTSVVSQ
ncbi:MAG: hypothetical protein M0R74_19275 [Dehalococcoidia bacterium]|nr:hypothetical protein [Dehalococcoidia bacterium]